MMNNFTPASNIMMHIWTLLIFLVHITIAPFIEPFSTDFTTVTNLNDSGAGSLRQAILDANNGDTIKFVATGTITLMSGPLVINKDLTITGLDTSSSAISGSNKFRVFEITSAVVHISDLTIKDGYKLDIDALGGGIYNSGNLTLDNILLTQNRARGMDNSFGTGGTASGGAVFNNGILTMDQVTLTGNSVTGGNGKTGGASTGGAIYNDLGGTVEITNSSISGNTSNGGIASAGAGGIASGGAIGSAGILTVKATSIYGNSSISGKAIIGTGGSARSGGIQVDNGSVVISGVELSNNFAQGGDGGTSSGGSAYGGGIFISNIDRATVINSTISQNTASGGTGAPGFPQVYAYGGAIYDPYGKGTFTFCTIVYNKVSAYWNASGGGILGGYSTGPTLKNSILIFNTRSSSEDDLSGTVVSGDYNFIGAVPANSLTGNTTHNVIGFDPGMDVLANNGGSTNTHALSELSPARNRVPESAGCGSPDYPNDQRGYPRNDGLCDVGAFEYHARPSDLVLDNASITENQLSGTKVGAFGIVTASTDKSATFSLVPGEGDTDNSLFLIDGDVLKINFSPNYETKNSYSIRIKALDTYGGSVAKPFTITIENVQEPPTDIMLENALIAENLPAKTVIGTLSSIDPDLNSTFTYSLIQDNQSSPSPVSISGNKLLTEIPIDFETSQQFSILIESMDNGGQAMQKTFTIYVKNVNESPVAINTLVDQSAIIGSLLHYNLPINAFYDPDFGDSLTYSATLLDGQSLPDWLLFDPTTMSFGGTPTTVGGFSVKVIAKDKGGLSAYQYITITVTDYKTFIPVVTR